MNTLRHWVPQFVRYVCALGLLSLGLVWACQSPGNERPATLIPVDKMAAILTEVHLAESQVSRLGLRSVDSSNVAYKHLERAIYKRFGVDTATYNRSYIYYSSHPREMETVYKRVVEKLQQKREAKPKPPTRS